MDDLHYRKLAAEPERNEVRLQELVDKFANQAGFTTEVFRANEKPVHVFDTTARCAWFTSDRDDAEDYGGGPVSRYYLADGSYLDAESESVIRLVGKRTVDDLCALSDAIPAIRKAFSGRYCGLTVVSYGMGRPILHYNPFFAGDIKSAAPYCYDDGGSIIDLSCRFAAGSDVRGAPVTPLAKKRSSLMPALSRNILSA